MVHFLTVTLVHFCAGERNWDVALPPTPKPGTPYGLTVVATDLHIRASLTKAERDAAVAFLKVVYGREFSSKLALKTGLVPPVLSYYNSPEMANNKIMQVFAAQVQRSVPAIEGTEWQEVLNGITTIFVDSLSNRRDPMAFAERATQEVNQRLKQYFKR